MRFPLGFQRFVHRFKHSVPLTAVTFKRFLQMFISFYLAEAFFLAPKVKKPQTNLYFLLFVFYRVEVERCHCGSKVVHP